MHDLTTMGPEAALRTVLTALLLAWAAWWCVGLLAALVDRRLAARLAPPLLRALLATGAVMAVQAPSHASTSDVDALQRLPRSRSRPDPPPRPHTSSHPARACGPSCASAPPSPTTPP